MNIEQRIALVVMLLMMYAYDKKLPLFLRIVSTVAFGIAASVFVNGL